MKKQLKDYIQFNLTSEDILQEAYERCVREMYAKAQPSADYDKIKKYLKECKSHRLVPERIYRKHYLSSEEYKYIQNKYLEAYRLKDQFRNNCDIIIRDMEEGYSKDKYISEYTDSEGNYHPSYKGFESIPSFFKQFDEEIAKKVIDFVKERKNYYQFEHDENSFIFSTGDIAPSSNAEEVINYWKNKGIDIKIDPRHYTENDFWNEEHGYLEEDEPGI